MQSQSESNVPSITGTEVVLPGPRREQSNLKETLKSLWADREYEASMLDQMFEAVGVEGRHLVLEPEQYGKIDGFGESNDIYVDKATQLGAEAVESACRASGFAPDELDALFFTTVTGIASPSIDAKVINELELDRQIDRTPMFGLGCVGGAAGIARVADYLRGTAGRRAALLSVELCSLTVERDDPGIPDLIASALFGDGAACVVCSTDPRDQKAVAPRLENNRGVFYRDKEWVMGWDIGENGFELILSGDLPNIVEAQLREDVEAFLSEHDYEIDDIEQWICHPGGPKVIDALQTALGLEDDDTAPARKSLREIGNLSSASVLHVLDEALEVAQTEQHWKKPAILMAMGPGFSAEFVLLE